MANTPTQHRVYRQTQTLIYKNFLLFYRAWFSTIIRALIFPIAFTVVMCVLKNINASSPYDNPQSGAIAPAPTPIKDLKDAIDGCSSKRLVFVRNGVSSDLLNPVLMNITQKLDGYDVQLTNEVNDLFFLCPQTLWGTSDCFAAVIFTAFNETDVEYTMALDGQYFNIYDGASTDYTDGLSSNRLLPLQWEIDSQVGNLPQSSKPSEQPWAGYFFSFTFSNDNYQTPKTGPVWLALIGMFVAPFFIVIHLGVSYHIGVFVARERETSISALMQAQMVTDLPRVLSTVLSFFALYFPGILVSSILLTQLLFTKTSDILFLFLSLLAMVSMIVSSHFLASFFGKSQLSGLYISTFVFALALVSLAATLLSSSPYAEVVNQSLSQPTANIQVIVLSLIFPPYTWATLVGDVANREFELMDFSLSPVTATLEEIAAGLVPQEALRGYLYVIFFLVQIIMYSTAAYWVERGMWGVKRPFDPIPGSSDVALRCTHLSKTYYSKRHWYWPFKTPAAPNQAVQALDLEVKKGSVTFLLGPNGGGKTTTLKCIAGMTAMDSGSRLEINESGVVFGICPQHNVFWDTLTVEEHVKIWKNLKTAAFQQDAGLDDDVLQECDLLDKVKARAKTLSGGQKRKLQLAISFTGGSSVCFIDEASSGLDPLSRRNIWNIIQNGHSKRTVLITTHFLDEADVLADHIAIVYKGKLVCAGPPTSLKTRYGGEYIIRSEPSNNDNNHDDGDDDNMVWRASTSSEAARKVLELETLTDDHLLVNFPTLEKVFLNVTDSTTAINESSGDGVAGEDTIMDEKAFAIETANARDLDLEVGRGISLVRQILTLFRKRYTLLLSKSGWISYGINLIIPIIIGGILAHYVPKLPSLQTCTDNVNILHNFGLVDQQGSKYAPLYYSTPEYLDSGYGPAVVLGPKSALSGTSQDDMYISYMGPYILNENAVYSGEGLEPDSNSTAILGTRKFVDSTSALVASVTNSSISSVIELGLWAPNQGSAILYHDADNGQLSRPTYGLSYITNRMANATNPGSRKSTANVQFMAHVESSVSFWSMPISLFIVIAFIAATSIAGIYPNYEKLNNVRMLEYCNGVSPLALWTANILFDMQFGLLQSLIVWGITFGGNLERLYYEGTNVLGALILFTLATYLGTYVLSLFIKKAAFAIAAGVHLLLFILYLVGYIVNQAAGNIATRHQTYSILQYVLGLTSPAANLGRALWISMNVFEVLCGEYGSDESPASSYKKYGSVYANLIIQIVFLISILGVYEYGSADWFRRHVTHRGVPARLHYLVDSGEIQNEKHARIANPADSSKILSVSRLTKFFGKNFAVQNISFDIAKGNTLALLGANGAGKTTTINLIRGDMKPDFGDITLDGISVLRQPHKARLHMGVCPQDDAVDNLTVRQTLSFYASVKGLKNVSGNVDKVLNALNITSFEHVMVKALSGGTKRKLSVAIALIGNPRVLLLDEPSTGQDAGAKRILWKTLKEIRGNRAILLTTHSMEEAESLATNVAIMGTRMLATGTLTSLQEQYGALYTIRAIRVPEVSESEAEEIVRYLFENRVVDYQDRHGQVIFNLPHNRSDLGKILRTMEALKGDRIEENSAAGAGRSSDHVKAFQDYTLTPPTLEEVFMQVSKEAGNNLGGS